MANETYANDPVRPVSVLFSEPKISQAVTATRPAVDNSVSVLFSEPKISQC